MPIRMNGRLNSIWQFLRLIRASNVLMVALTMVIIKFLVFEQFILREVATTGLYDDSVKFSELFDLQANYNFNFFLLVLSTCFIAAAGNIINDYFDIKADRVNRPDKIVIGKYIKRRWAIVLHWGFNSAGVLIGFYLAWVYKSWWLALIPFFSVNMLWLYSTYLKRREFFGNFFVALLTALVIILSAHFMLLNLPEADVFRAQFDYKIILNPSIFLSGLLAVFAFITNLTREIVKDLHDVRGDLKMNCRTIPIVHGERFTRILIGVLLFIQMMAVLMILVIGSSNFSTENSSIFPVIIILTLNLGYISAFIINIIAKDSATHYRISWILKVIMLAGILFPINLLL